MVYILFYVLATIGVAVCFSKAASADSDTASFLLGFSGGIIVCVIRAVAMIEERNNDR